MSQASRPPALPSSPSGGVGSPAFDRHAKAPPAWEMLEGGKAALARLFRSWSLPALGEAKLLEVLDSEPVSHVRATRGSVALHVPSAKMNRVIQAASRTVEYAFIHYCEYHPDVLLYLDQPLTVQIRITDSLNRSRPVKYTCDYLVVLRSGVRVYECKPLEWLQAQSGRPNARYVYSVSEDAWSHPAAVEAFRRYGYSHHVFHSGEVNSLWIRNVRFLDDYCGIEPPKGVDEASAALRRSKSLSFGAACQVPGTSRETWFWLIACGTAAFDLERDPLDRPDLLALASVHVSYSGMLCQRLALESYRKSGVVPSLSGDPTVCLEPGASVIYQDVPHHVVSRNAHQLVLCVAGEASEGRASSPIVIPLDAVSAFLDSGHLRAVKPDPRDLVSQHSRRLLASVTPAERERALRRWSAVVRYRSSGTVPSEMSRSGLFKYLRWAREASQVYGSEFLGMFRTGRSAGSRKVTPDQLVLLRDVSEAFHRGKYNARVEDGSEPPLASRKRFPAAYADYLRLSGERGLEPRSSRTLRRELKRYSIETSERNRRGYRAAYPHSSPQGRLSNDLPVHGKRPFEVAHVDHQVLDVWCVSGATNAVLGRPWITLVFDAFSRMPLGFTLRFDSPCIYSVLCAIFDCVLRHKRFADSLVDDQGPEFESPDLAVALAYLRATHTRRPPTNPRFGALIERQFGSLKTRVIDELSGSIDTVARSRELTSSHDPQRHALWTLPSLSKLLEAYLFDRYPNLVHGALGAPPREVFESATAQAGERVARRVSVDAALSLALSETVPGSNGCRTVPKRGGYVRVGYLDFHHPDFSDARVAGRSIPIRRSPADASFIYVLLPHRGTWEPARLVAGSVDVTNCSWRQARAMIEENGRQRLIASLPANETNNAKTMAGLLLSIDDHERGALARRRALDAEQQLETSSRIGVAAPGDGGHPGADAPEVVPHPGPRAAMPEPRLVDSTGLRSYDEEPE